MGPWTILGWMLVGLAGLSIATVLLKGLFYVTLFVAGFFVALLKKKQNKNMSRLRESMARHTIEARKCR